MIRKLLDAGGKVQAFDPEAMDNVKGVIGDTISYASNAYEALQDADALLICTEWSVFRNPDLQEMSRLMKNKAIFDGRNLYETSKMSEEGFFYKSIGRTTVNKSKTLSTS